MGGPAFKGGRPHVNNYSRGSNSRPHRLLDTSACNSVLLRSSFLSNPKHVRFRSRQTGLGSQQLGNASRTSTTLSRLPSPRISLRSSSDSIRRNSIDPRAIRSDTCVRMSLNSKNREAYHVYTKAALARLRSGSSRGTGDRNRNDRTARNDHLTPIAGSERIKYILTAGEKSVRVSRGTALIPRRPRRAALSLNLVHAPGPGLRLSEQGAHSPQRSAASRL
jgi:hypothetical protein